MPLLDLDATPVARKRQLAELVAARLIALGHEAEVVRQNVNESGHTDRVIVRSSIGLVHTTASNQTDPNQPIPVADYDAGRSQKFLEGKDWVAYGWVDRSRRTLVQFVRCEHVLGRPLISKTEILRLADRTLSIVFPP